VAQALELFGHHISLEHEEKKALKGIWLKIKEKKLIQIWRQNWTGDKKNCVRPTLRNSGKRVEQVKQTECSGIRLGK